MRCLIGKLVVIVAVLIAATVITGPSALAQEGQPNEAGLVVVHNDGRVSYSLVTFSEETISGIELLERSGFEVTQVPFGGLGVGICSIDATGCDVSVCRQRVCQGAGRDDPYWQYFIANPDGSWSSSALGVSADTITSGDVRAFVWSVNAPDMTAPGIGDVRSRATQQVGENAWLTRYAADGTVLGSAESDSRPIPFAAIALVGAGLVGLGVVVMRSRAAKATP